MTIIQNVLRLFRNGATEQEIEEELRFHIEMRTRDNVATGMSPETAAADAERRFGDFDQVKAESRQISREKSGGVMNPNVMKGIALVMFGCGLALNLTSNVHSLRQVGSSLMVIAFLWRVYLRFRAAEPDQQRINQRLQVAEQTPLGIIASVEAANDEQPNRTIASCDEQGRTPVERILADDYQKL